MDVSTSTLLLRALALAAPLTLGLASLATPRHAALRHAARAAVVVLVLAVAVALGWSLEALLVGDLPGSVLGVRLDVVSVVMLLLVTTIALVITRYSGTYLRGDPGAPRYARWLLATLAAVTLLVLSSSLLGIALAWTGTSLSLHQLLTFYGDRTPALVAAHKKFLVSRLADACMLAALGLVAADVGSLELDALDAYAAGGSLPVGMHVAAVLVVCAVGLRSAQLPFHGWLTQVMEAPTPVSALLHAGVVNIGGLVMIRLAPVMALAPLAQALLVAIGTVTAVVAALVMTTRVSIKVALAWSTCAQMGFMLVECGLGAWHLALLHLVAHSLYKAHAFLSSGSVVEGWRVRSLARAPGAGRGGVPILGLVIRGLSVVVLYLAWSELFGVLLPRPEPATGEIASLARGVSYGVVLAGLLALLGAQVVLALRPYGRLARALHPTLFAGLYLDELFTRLTFRIWPPRLPSRPGPLHPLGVAPTLEA